MSCAIKVSNLQKSYGSHVVLKDLSFCVRQGEIFGLLGVNGAGKTTTLECIEGLRRYDNGSVAINGQIGIQLQSASLPEHIKPLEAAKLFAKWNKASLDKAMLEALGIYEFAKKQYFQLSTGQKRRLHLALALTRNPDILFLDEPTARLDVEGWVALHEQIRRLKASGKKVYWGCRPKWKTCATGLQSCPQARWLLLGLSSSSIKRRESAIASQFKLKR